MTTSQDFQGLGEAWVVRVALARSSPLGTKHKKSECEGRAVRTAGAGFRGRIYVYASDKLG